jgi:hypothetical protein
MSASNGQECPGVVRGINAFPRITDERGDLLSDSQHILNAWEIFSAHEVNGCQAGRCTHIIRKPSRYEVKIDIEQLKRCKLPGIDGIPAESI